MVHDRPLLAVPFEVVGAGGQVAAVEEHPHQTIGFELVSEVSCGLQKLIAVVEPRRFDEATHRKNYRDFLKVFWGNVKSVALATN